MSEHINHTAEAAVEAVAKALFSIEEPDRNAFRWDKPNPDDENGPFAWRDYWLTAARTAIVAMDDHLREALAADIQMEKRQAWREGYWTGKRDYAASVTGGVPISTPNPHEGSGHDA